MRCFSFLLNNSSNSIIIIPLPQNHPNLHSALTNCIYLPIRNFIQTKFMKKALSAITIIVLSVCFISWQNGQYPITKSDAEWKKSLNTEQYYILRQKGTERAFT